MPLPFRRSTRGGTGALRPREWGAPGRRDEPGTVGYDARFQEDAVAPVDATITGATGTAAASGTAAAFNVAEAGGTGAAAASGTPAPLNVIVVGGAGSADAAGGTGSFVAVDGGGTDATITGGTGAAAASGTDAAFVVDEPVEPPPEPPMPTGGRFGYEPGGDETSIIGVSARMIGHTGVAHASGGYGRFAAVDGPEKVRVRVAPRAVIDATMIGHGGAAAAVGGSAVLRASSRVEAAGGWAVAAGGTGRFRVSGEQDPLEDEDAVALLMLGVL